MSERNDLEPLLTLDDVAAYLGVSARTVRREVGRRRLRAVRVGRQLRFRPRDVVQYEEGKPEEKSAMQTAIGLQQDNSENIIQ